METKPLAFCILDYTSLMNTWAADIKQCQADEAQNPQNKSFDDQQISYYQQLEDNEEQLQKAANSYAPSNDNPAILKEIQTLSSREQTLSQLAELGSYIQSLKEDAKNNPADAAEDAQKIANAQAQQKCIEQFQKAYEAYQQSGDQADANELNSIIQELQQLREENPSSPLSSGPIFEDFQAIVDKYTVFEINGHKYAVSPSG